MQLSNMTTNDGHPVACSNIDKKQVYLYYCKIN